MRSAAGWCRFPLVFAAGLAVFVTISETSGLGAHFQGQPTAGQAVAFEVVSIKPARPSAPLALGGHYSVEPGGRFRALGITAQGLIMGAFMVVPSEVIGGPAWLSTAQFEIQATTGTYVSSRELVAQLPALLRALLEDRFGLKAHAEARPFPVYALVKARKDGRLGPKLRMSAPDCDNVNRDAGSPNVLGDLPPSPFCSFRNGPGTLAARGITMNALAEFLRNGLDRIALDRTELAGRFDVDLEWSPERMRLDANRPADAPDGPSLFTALQDQLGLKLEPRNEPLEAVVVDHIERPTPN